MIFTATLKTEELRKYDVFDNVNPIDYSANETNKLLQNKYAKRMSVKINEFGILNRNCKIIKKL